MGFLGSIVKGFTWEEAPFFNVRAAILMQMWEAGIKVKSKGDVYTVNLGGYDVEISSQQLSKKENILIPGGLYKRHKKYFDHMLRSSRYSGFYPKRGDVFYCFFDECFWEEEFNPSDDMHNLLSEMGILQRNAWDLIMMGNQYGLKPSKYYTKDKKTIDRKEFSELGPEPERE